MAFDHGDKVKKYTGGKTKQYKATNEEIDVSTENLVLAILNNKAADSKRLFEEIIIGKVQNLVETKLVESTGALMLDEDTKNAINYFDDVHGYFNSLLEDGTSIEDAINMMVEDENIGKEATSQYLDLLEKYLEEHGPEDENEDEEEDDEEVEDDSDEDDDA